MEVVPLVMLGGVVFFILSKIYEGYKARRSGDDGRRHCMTCGIEAEPVEYTKGSFAIELILWLCLILPGLIYSIWRITSRVDECAACGATTLVPMNSPAAVNQRAKLGATQK